MEDKLRDFWEKYKGLYVSFADEYRVEWRPSGEDGLPKEGGYLVGMGYDRFVLGWPGFWKHARSPWRIIENLDYEWARPLMIEGAPASLHEWSGWYVTESAITPPRAFRKTNSSCPLCRSDGLLLFTSFECSNESCKNYRRML